MSPAVKPARITKYFLVHTRELDSTFSPPDDIFHTVGIDRIGYLPRSKRGNKYILLAVDYLLMYVEVKAVPTLRHRT